MNRPIKFGNSELISKSSSIRIHTYIYTQIYINLFIKREKVRPNNQEKPMEG